jgi:multiple sugar transport system permease protein
MATAAKRVASRRAKRAAENVVIAAVIVIVVVWTLFPIYWAILNSVKHPGDTFGSKWIPWVQFDPTLQFWRGILRTPEIQQALKNSFIISVGAATVALFLGTLAAYAIARFRFRHPTNGTITTWFLSQRILPPVIFVTPYYLLIREFHLLDSVWALVLLNATFNLPFPVIILSQMFRELPIELEEAAQVDGANRFQMFTRIALPLVAPGLVVAWIIPMAFSWNEYIFAATIAQVKAVPIPMIIAGAEGTRGIDYQFVGTRVTLALVPPMLLALAAQRYIVRGLSLGAVKG